MSVTYRTEFGFQRHEVVQTEGEGGADGRVAATDVGTTVAAGSGQPNGTGPDSKGVAVEAVEEETAAAVVAAAAEH